MKRTFFAALLLGTGSALALESQPPTTPGLDGKVEFMSGLFCNTPDQVAAVISIAGQNTSGDPKEALNKAVKDVNRAEGPSCFYTEHAYIASTYLEQVAHTNSGGFSYSIHKVRIVGTFSDEPCITRGGGEPSCEPKVKIQPFTHPKEQYVFTSPLHNFAGAQSI
jgi:hypothetical protein